MTGAESSPRLVFDWEKKCRELEAEVERLRGSERAASDCYAAAEGELTAIRAALSEWRKHDSAPDCVACAALDAALAGGGE